MAGVDLEKSKGATSMSVGCNGESAGAACASMSIGGHEELACVACPQSQSLCGECTICLAEYPSVGCCIPCQEKKNSNSVSLSGDCVSLAVDPSIGYCNSFQEKKSSRGIESLSEDVVGEYRVSFQEKKRAVSCMCKELECFACSHNYL